VTIESLTAIGGLLSIAFLREAHQGMIGATFALVGGGFLYLVAIMDLFALSNFGPRHWSKRDMLCGRCARR